MSITTNSITEGVLRQDLHAPRINPVTRKPPEVGGLTDIEKDYISKFINKEAETIEKEASQLLNESKAHQGYSKLELSKSLRVTANFLIGKYELQ